jgi:hypothetical protein
MDKRCKNCLAPESDPWFKLNEERICNFCVEFKKNAGKEEKISLRPDKEKAAEEFKKMIEESKGKGEYDCLLLFSGGKDSSYLLYLLAKEYGLKTLAVTVDVGVLTDLAIENIKRVPEKLGVDHVFVKPEKEFLKKLFRYYMLNPNKPTITSSICEVCQNLMRSSGIIMAVEKKIPIVTMAYNENEARGLEMPKELIQKSWVPQHLYNEPFDENDRRYFWDPKRYDEQNIPRFVYPYWATGFPGVEFIIKRLEELGLASKKQSNPLYTNCWFHWLTMYLDFNIKGYNPYYRLAYDLIRRGQVRRTQLYLFFTVGAWLFRHGFYNRKMIKKGFDYLDLKMEDFPKKS